MIFNQLKGGVCILPADVVAKLGQRVGDAFNSNKEVILFTENQ